MRTDYDKHPARGSLLPQVLLVGSGMWIGCLGTLTLLNLGVTFR